MRAEKESMVDEMRALALDGSFLLFADYGGMDVAAMQALRHGLRPLGASVMVVKRRLFARAVAGEHWGGLGEALRGPTAVVFGRGDAAATAKWLDRFAAEHSRPTVLSGVLDGAILSRVDVESLARLPPRGVLLGRLAGTLAAPMMQLAGVARQKLMSLLYVLKAIEEKKS